MNSEVSRKSVVPIQAASSILCELALTDQSSMILKGLPVKTIFPLVILSFFKGALLPGPPATLNGVKSALLADR